MKNISPAKPGISEDCAGQSEQLRQESGDTRGKTPPFRIEQDGDFAELVAERLLFAFRHCASLPDGDGPAELQAQDVSQCDSIKHLTLAERERENRRDLKLYLKFTKLVLHDASWFRLAWEKRLSERPRYRNPDALMYDAFMFMYDVPLDDADVREWLRTADFDSVDGAAPPATWSKFKDYCRRVAEHLRKEGRAPIREMPFAVAPVVASPEIVRGIGQLAAELRRSVRSTLRVIEGGKAPIVETPEGIFAMRDALGPHRSHDNKLAA